MGKATRKKLQEEAAREQAIVGILTSYRDSGKTYRGIIRGADIIPKYVCRFSSSQINDFRDWVYTGKSKRKDKQQIALIRYMFAIYPAPRFLEEVFVSEDKNLFDKFGSWYLAAAQGKSLYKTCTRGILSKKESHWLLQAPANLSIKEAIWWAKGMAISQDRSNAHRLSQSPISRRGSHTNDFWIDVHRFFMNNPVQMNELQELIDYIQGAQAENPEWTIKKRSLEAIRRQSNVWHRDMAKLKKIGGGSWDGMDIPPWIWKTGKFDNNPQKNTKTEWTIHELTTGSELAKEGNKMRHCVSGYKHRCMNGSCSIFALRSSTMLYDGKRHLTIEVSRAYGNPAVVQVKGLANRPPKGKERNIVEKWATANNITIHSSRYYNLP